MVTEWQLQLAKKVANKFPPFWVEWCKGQGGDSSGLPFASATGGARRLPLVASFGLALRCGPLALRWVVLVALFNFDLRRAEEAFERTLLRLPPGSLQTLHILVDPLLAERVLEEVLDEALEIRLLELEVNARRLHGLALFEEVARGMVVEILWDFLLIRVFQHLFQRAMLQNEFDRRGRANALQRVAIITTAQDTKVDELFHGDVQLLQNTGQRHLIDLFLLRLGRHQVTNEYLGAERETIGVLCGRRVHFSVPAQRRARGFGLARGFDNRNAHEFQQLLGLLVVLLRHLCSGLGALLNSLAVTRLLGLLKARSRRLTFFASCGQLGELQLRGLAVEDVHGLDAIFHELDRACEHPDDVRRHLAVFVGELLVRPRMVLTDHNQKLVEAHAGVDGEKPPGVGLRTVDLPHRLRRRILQKLHKSFNPHCESARAGQAAG
mmetsp:Transcript_72878/g.202160  ORF Transcript_72878/g.202160 Transcript_72878/m.202160 type:complete len:438 (+) Transcript_72878:31-1344(+)